MHLINSQVANHESWMVRCLPRAPGFSCEQSAHYEKLDWLSVFFHVYSLIHELTYICLHKRLTELVSSIHFLCDLGSNSILKY